MFPADVAFHSLQVAPREPRFVLRLIETDLFGSEAGGERPPFDSDGLGDERHIEAGLGGTIPLWGAVDAERDRSVSVALQTGVFARFRAERSRNDLVATDWLVAAPLAARAGPFEARLRLVHWSAHIGDELVETNGLDRIDFTHEALELLGAYRAGVARFYGGGGLVLRSQLGGDEPLPPDFSDDATVQLGAEIDLALDAPGHTSVVAALDLQWADRTEWRDRVTAALGVERVVAGRGARLLAHYERGPSPLGQFFRTDETAWGIGIGFEL